MVTGVSVSCSPASITTAQTSTCTPTVTGTGSYGSAVAWSVSPSSAGSVNSSGIFTPSVAGTATITATSTQVATKYGQAQVAVTAQSGVTISPASAQVQVFHQQQFTVTLPGNSSAAFNWSVNGVLGGNLQLGQIDSTGLYTAPNSLPSPSTVTIAATNQANSTQSATASLVIQPDAVAPAITSVSPNADQTGVALDAAVVIQFSDALDPSTVNSGNFVVTSPSGSTVPSSVAYDASAYAVTVQPAGILSPGTSYSVTVSQSVADPSGAALASQFTWTFTTEAPISVSGVLPAALVANPTSLVVLSYGGSEATPDANGNFTASVTPMGNSMIAAMVPGKNFGWMAVVSKQSSASAQAAVQAARAQLRTYKPARGVRPVNVTHYQITSSGAAASNPGSITTDATTTAEAILFETPYFYTSNPSAAATIQIAIDSDPNIPALAQALESSQSESDPLSDANVQAAMQNAILSILGTLTQAAPQQAATAVVPSGTGGKAFSKMRAASTQPASLQGGTTYWPYETPNCYTGSPEPWANCIDLEFLQLNASSTLDANGNFTITVANCASVENNLLDLGCSTNWLLEVAPITNPPSGGVGSITYAPGANGDAASPTAIYNQSCTQASPPSGCFFIWLPAASGFDQGGEDLSSILEGWLHLQHAPLGQEQASVTFTIPGNVEQDYVLRAYSGGFADSTELTGIVQGDYNPDSMALAANAFLGNVYRAATNFGGGLSSLVSDLSPESSDQASNDSQTMSDIMGEIDQCVLQDAITNGDLTNELSFYKSSVQSGGLSTTDYFQLTKIAANDIFHISATYQATCAQGILNDEWDTVKGYYSGLIWEIHAFQTDPNSAVVQNIDAALEQAVSGPASIVSGLGDGIQTVAEMIKTATPIETAIIRVTTLGTPQIAQLRPSTVPAISGAQSIQILGANFADDAQVYWMTPSNVKQGPDHSSELPSTSELTVSKDFGEVTGNWQVQVVNPTGNAPSTWYTFSVSSSTNAKPDLVPENVTLGSGAVAAGGTVTVNFTVLNQGNAAAISSATGFRIGTSAMSAPGPAGDIPNSLLTTPGLAAGKSIQQSQTLTIPAATPAGTYYVWVVVDDVVNSNLGQSNTGNDYAPSNALNISASQNPAPKVSGVSPTPVPASTSASLLTINGTNFVQNASLIFYDPQKNQYLRSATFINSGTLTHQFDNNADVGQWTVIVQNPDGQESPQYTFQVSNSATPPALQQIATTPNPPVPGQPFTFTLTGNGFDPSSAEVLISGPGCTPCTVPNSALTTKTTGQIVSGYTLSTAGTYSVTVENTASSTQSTALPLTVGVSAVPSVSYISPTAMTANGTSNPNATQTLYIYGSNFNSGNVVQFYWTQGSNAYNWNNSNSTPTITSALITIPMDPGTVADTIRVRVCESASQAISSTCSSGTQAVTVLTPTVSGVSPSPVPSLNGNQTLTIAGTGFVAGATVTYYDPSNTAYAAKAATVSSSTQIVDTQFNDAADPGTWHVVVTNSGASASNSYAFTVQ